MARHLVISFASDEEATAFMAALKVEGSVFFQGADGHFTHSDPAKIRVIGVFAKPTKFCECEYVTDMKTARSQKYGWYLHHPGCGKPIPGHYQSALKNLLDPPGLDTRKRGIFLGVREGELRYPEPRSSTKG